MHSDREDGDTWDITTSVGSTALFVAAARALEAQKPEPLALDPYAEVFCRAAGGAWATVLDGDGGEDVGRLRSEDFGQHFVSFQAARTKYFDAYFAAAADAGIRQVVLLAAGLDSRAHRLPWPDGTVVYELDQPKVLEFKRTALAEVDPGPAPVDRRDVAIDLRDDWVGALTAAGFDPSQPSAWIAEGLLIYLPATAQEQLFSGIDALAAPGSRVAVEEGRPMPAEVFAAKQKEERQAGPAARSSTSSTTNRLHPPTSGSPCAGGRPRPRRSRTISPGLDAPSRPTIRTPAPMVAAISLVSAVKH